MAPTKSNQQFKAFNLQRKKQHEIPSPPLKTQRYPFDQGEWEAVWQARPADRTRLKNKVASKKSRVSKKAPAKKLPHGPFDVLRASPYDECLECNQTGDDDSSCGAKCYHKFRKQFVSSKIDIKGPGPHGYGAYTKPGVSFKKGQYLDEYIGKVRPVIEGQPSKSRYVFQIADGVFKCDIDAEKAGSWTRFINSNCRPNVHPYPQCVGGRHVLVFEALRDIGPEEELTFFYGKNYFKAAGFDCTCSAYKTPHVPHKRR